MSLINITYVFLISFLKSAPSTMLYSFIKHLTSAHIFGIRRALNDVCCISITTKQRLANDDDDSFSSLPDNVIHRNNMNHQGR